MRSFFSKFFGKPQSPGPAPETLSPLDYDQLVLLDAEDLAEQGIGSAYNELIPLLQRFVDSPTQIEEAIDPDSERYAVRVRGLERLVYGPELPGSDRQSWGRATYVLFELVNEQLEAAPVRFYAINGGNDLGGMFLTPSQVQEAQLKLARKSDWPYIPELAEPWWGQHH